MNNSHEFSTRLNRLAIFVGLLTLQGLAGCNSAGDAMPSATDVTVKHDAAVKRDTASSIGTGGGAGDPLPLVLGAAVARLTLAVQVVPRLARPMWLPRVMSLRIYLRTAEETRRRPSMRVGMQSRLPSLWIHHPLMLRGTNKTKKCQTRPARVLETCQPRRKTRLLRRPPTHLLRRRTSF